MPYYMKFEGIEGPMTGKYKGWIELLGVSFSSENQSSGYGGSTALGSSAIRILILKYQDSSSPKLNAFSHGINNQGFKVAIDLCEKNSTVPCMSYEMEGALIVGSINKVGVSPGDLLPKTPTESFELVVTKLSSSVKPTTAAKDPQNIKSKVWWNRLLNIK